MTFTLFISGCSNVDIEKRKDSFKELAISYYETYAKGHYTVYPDKFEISISRLEDANMRVAESFDLDLLSDCEKSSTITLTLNEDGEILDYIFNVVCN